MDMARETRDEADIKAMVHRIDDLLRDRGKARPWLAQETGISVKTINNWGQRKSYPEFPAAIKVARALGTTAEYLYDGTEPIYKEPAYKHRKQKKLVKFIMSLDEGSARELWAAISVMTPQIGMQEKWIAYQADEERGDPEVAQAK